MLKCDMFVILPCSYSHALCASQLHTLDRSTQQASLCAVLKEVVLTIDHGCAGDLMKSIYLLMYKAEENVIEMRARDFHSNYMTAVTILDDDTYLGAENSYNLFTVRKNSDVAADEDRNRLEVRQRSLQTDLTGGCFPLPH